MFFQNIVSYSEFNFAMITASVVTFHTSHDDVDNLLRSVENSAIDIMYVIDNSNDDSLRNYVAGRPKVRYIKNINNGYGAGHNVAIRQSIQEGADYHIVINPDIYWDGPVIETLTEFMDNHKDCGLVIPKVCNPDGTIRFVCRLLPTPSDLILRRFIPSRSLKEKNDNQYQLRFTGYQTEMQVPTVSGCFMFMRNSILKRVGGFDDRFFMYMEDVDLSRRIGMISKVMFCPDETVFHVADQGSYKNKKLLKYHLQSAFRYFRKWGWFFDSERRRTNSRIMDKFKSRAR